MALDDSSAGEDFRRARDVLQPRVNMGDALYAPMLNALVRFGELHGSIREQGCVVPAYVDLALGAFVAGCRIAAFDRTFSGELGDPTPRASTGAIADLPSGIQSSLRELGEPLAAIERDLTEYAEYQDWTDGRGNAIAMRKAAAHVARARGILAAGRTP